MRPLLVGLLLVTFQLLCIGCASDPSSVRSHTVVHINNMKLAPEVVEISGSANSIVWTNQSGSAATIQFPASIATAFSCDELRPIFVLSGDRVESAEVLRSGESLTSPCPLKPGSYSYEVWLSETRTQRENPHLKINGRIEVGD